MFGRVVLISTADVSVGGSVASQLERAGYETVQRATGEETVRLAREGGVALVVLDLELADMSGYEACFELRQALGSRLPIILLSRARTEPSDRVAGLLIGADDYLAMPFDPGELLARARRLLARAPSPVPSIDVPLTGREQQVLQLLADGLSQDEIAKELFISPKTVGTHIQRILAKLGVHSRTEAVALAFRHGLVAGPAMEP